MSLADLDLWIFQAINGLCGRSAMLDRLVGGLDMTSLKGMAIVAVFAALWHLPSKDQQRQREVLLILFFAVAASLLVNRSISLIMPFRTRPMVTPDIGYNAPAAEHHADLEHWSSFPSDNATLLFAVATCFWFVARGWGLGFGLFSVAALLARIYLGVHYPFDIIVGALLGIGGAIALNRAAVRAVVSRPVLQLERLAPAYFHALLFAALFELATMFSLTRKVGKTLYQIALG